MRWSDFAELCPELAAIGRRRLEERHLCLIGTLRADGSPRISPVEPYLVAGERRGLYEAIGEAHEWPEPMSEDPAYYVFRVEPTTAGYVCFDGSSWQDWSWNPQRGGLRKRNHPAS